MSGTISLDYWLKFHHWSKWYYDKYLKEHPDQQFNLKTGEFEVKPKLRSLPYTLHILRGQVGTVERPVNITKYGEWMDANGLPWCASFVSWVLHTAGFSGHGSASAQRLYDQFRKRGRSGKTPRVGAAIFFHMRGGHAGVNHTGMVVGVSRFWVDTIEGNTSSGVSGSQINGGGVYPRRRLRGPSIVGYGYPAYE
ncbi:MAG: CHAP domain-containing protein [Gemmatimonadaceae bacterium]|jgi:hypothetical protein